MNHLENLQAALTRCICSLFLICTVATGFPERCEDWISEVRMYEELIEQIEREPTDPYDDAEVIADLRWRIEEIRKKNAASTDYTQ